MAKDHQKDKPHILTNLVVSGIMHRTLPAGDKISKEAKESMTECATEFISFVTKEASIKCHNDNREIVDEDDIRWVLSSSEAMLKYFHKYGKRENEKIPGSRQDSNEEKSMDLNLLPQESSEDQSKESRTVPNLSKDSNKENMIDLNLSPQVSEDQSKESGIVLNEIPVLDHMEHGTEVLANESRTPLEIDSGILGEANDSEDLTNKRRTPVEFEFGVVDKGKKPRI